MKEPAPLQQTDRTYVVGRDDSPERVGGKSGRKLLYFSGCDYFRLASHPKVLAALRKAPAEFGLNVAASRLTTGNHMLYLELESALKQFFQAPDALLVPTGYLSSLIFAQAFRGHFSHVLLDDRSHPALRDAAHFFDCPLLEFASKDPAALKSAVDRCGPGARFLVMTDGMFARDGAVAPLAEYLRILPRDGLLLVDDAHGAGVLGKHGRGTPEHAGVPRSRIIQTITLSKAFGCYGGAILATPRIRQQILARSSAFVGSTPFPLPIAAAALAAVNLLRSDQGLRKRLFANANYLKARLREGGREIVAQPGPIVPIFPKHSAEKKALHRALLAAGIFPPLIQYPGAPAGGFFRFVIASEHTRAQLDTLAGVLARF